MIHTEDGSSDVTAVFSELSSSVALLEFKQEQQAEEAQTKSQGTFDFMSKE